MVNIGQATGTFMSFHLIDFSLYIISVDICQAPRLGYDYTALYYDMFSV